MSLMDPLLKSVKYLIQEFHSVGEVVKDDNVYLDKFCNTLEQCFVKGMKQGKWDVNIDNVASKRRQRFWKILASYETDGPIPFTISAAIASTLQNKRIKTNDGRFRYIIRHCLVHRSLHVLVEFMRSRRNQLKFWYYEDQGSGTKAMKTMAQFGGGSSILIHEELSEQFRSLLLTCSTSLQFELQLDNSFFLDETWLMPATQTVEFVPTCELGIELIYIHGYGIITKLKAGSVAADANNLGVGDLLVEMNGQTLFPATFGGDNDARSVWRYCRKHSIPCKLTVIKPRSPCTGGIYMPLRTILAEYHSWMEVYYKDQQKRMEDQQIKEEVKQVEMLSPSKNKDKAPVLDPHAAEGGVGGLFQVHYIGEVSTGEDGGVMQIEKVIRQMSYKQSQKLPLKVKMSLTQIAVETSLVHDRDSDVPLLSHKYADISSCGKILSNECRFCYIAGDTFCTISKQFKGYVFEAESLAQARTILNCIYQGFKRTTWFM